MCQSDKNMAEAEEYDAISFNVSLEFILKSQEELAVSSKKNEY